MSQPITVLRTDEATVTLAREEFERLIAVVEDARDLAALAAQDAREEVLGKEVARADYLSSAAVRRLLAGESPVRVWREHRGMTQRGLAEAAGVSAPYLAQIESGLKPGSLKATAALARVLRVSVDDLVPSEEPDA